MIPATKRLWPRFSLRTIFVVVTVVGGWLGHQLNWLRQREAWRNPTSGAIRATLPNDPPGSLWLFREQGESWIEIRNGTDEQAAKIQKLFPEAVVIIEGQRPTTEQIESYKRISATAGLFSPVSAPSP